MANVSHKPSSSAPRLPKPGMSGYSMHTQCEGRLRDQKLVLFTRISGHNMAIDLAQAITAMRLVTAALCNPLSPAASAVEHTAVVDQAPGRIANKPSESS